MLYVGVDIGKEKHAAAAIDEAGKCVMPPCAITHDASGFAAFLGQLGKLGEKSEVIVGMEATGHYWRVPRHTLAAHGYRVDVVNPLITSREASADVRGRKTDKLDALAIANVLLKGKYSPTPAEHPVADSLKALTRHRKGLVERRSDAKNRLTASLDVVFPEAAKTLNDLFSDGSMAVIKALPSARLVAEADIRKLTTLFAKASRGQQGREQAEAYRGAARRSLALKISNEGEEFIIAQIIDEISAIQAQVDEVERRIRAEPQPVIAQVLSSIKGAGKIQPMVIAAEYGDISRFKGRKMIKKMLAYAGCEPRVRESGQWKGRLKMSKRGSRPLRHALYTMAGTVILHSPYFKQVYQRQVDKGKHHSVAMSHVIRKIIAVMCGMYKTNTSFCPPKTEELS